MQLLRVSSSDLISLAILVYLFTIKDIVILKSHIRRRTSPETRTTSFEKTPTLVTRLGRDR